MSTIRALGTGTSLPDGRVLVTGGYANNSTVVLASSELFNPVTGTWALTANALYVSRNGHSATLLLSGKVMVAGGRDQDDVRDQVELFNPATNLWTAAAPLPVSRVYHSATRYRRGQGADRRRHRRGRTHPRRGRCGTRPRGRGPPRG